MLITNNSSGKNKTNVKSWEAFCFFSQHFPSQYANHVTLP